MESTSPHTDHRHRVEIIAHCGWPDFRLPLGFRQADELMLRHEVRHT
ncbi:hypothetical protein QOM21_31910 [Streptomyces sp. Pv4-95]